ncbi:MAG TPA: 50S ribosomal protein L25/general stress protein Ctc, partial [Allosphingosinicella sp.]
PAVVYGNKEEPLAIHLEEKALVKAMSNGHFMNSVVMIEVASGGTARTLPKDVQFHPVTDRPLHVDFLRISEHSTVTVNVPIRFTGEEESRGIKRGGVLNPVRHELELVCDAAEIPDEIVISIASMNIGDSLHISAVELPKGVSPAITDRDFTIATVVPSSGSVLEAEDAAAEAEVAADEVPATDATRGDEEKDHPAQTQD